MISSKISHDLAGQLSSLSLHRIGVFECAAALNVFLPNQDSSGTKMQQFIKQSKQHFLLSVDQNQVLNW